MVEIDLPNQIFRRNDAGGNGISECMEFDCLMGLEILFAEENVEVWILFDRNVDLVRLLWTVRLGGAFCLMLLFLSLHTCFACYRYNYAIKSKVKTLNNI